jgi:hypothetical protein
VNWQAEESAGSTRAGTFLAQGLAARRVKSIRGLASRTPVLHLSRPKSRRRRSFCVHRRQLVAESGLPHRQASPLAWVPGRWVILSEPSAVSSQRICRIAQSAWRLALCAMPFALCEAP